MPQVMNIEVDISIDMQYLRPKGSEVNRLYGPNTRLHELPATNRTMLALRVSLEARLFRRIGQLSN